MLKRVQSDEFGVRSKFISPSTELQTIDFPLKSLDDVFSLWINSRSHLLRKFLLGGERAGGISSYGAGWMAGRGIDVIVLDGANRFDPYQVSFFAKKALMLRQRRTPSPSFRTGAPLSINSDLQGFRPGEVKGVISPEILLKRIQIARAFTCYQMVTLIGEKLVSLLNALPKKPWVILLGLVTPFLDEDVPEREVRPLFEKVLKKMEGLAAAGVPFFLFEDLPFSPFSKNPSFAKGGQGGLIHSKRSYLGKRLFQFSDLVLRIDLNSEGPRMVIEKIADSRWLTGASTLPSPSIGEGEGGGDKAG